jgi:hypothetical protein
MPVHFNRWSPDDDAKLISLMDGWRSTSEIAKMLGRFSRNSVMSRIHRLRAAGKIPPDKTLRPTRLNGKVQAHSLRRKPKSAIREKYVFGDGPPPHEPRPLMADLTSRFVEGYLGQTGRVSISDLKIDQCKFPIDQPTGGVMYCGLEVAPGGSWCRDHAERVFNTRPTENHDGH